MIRHLYTGFLYVAWAVLAVAAVALLAPLIRTVEQRAGEGAQSSSLYPEPPGASSDITWGSLTGPPPPVSAPSAIPQATSIPGNPLSTAATTPVPTTQAAGGTAVPGGTVYVVQQKDTLWSVAKAHGVTVDAIVKANGLKDSGYIRVGQKLIIPER